LHERTLRSHPRRRARRLPADLRAARARQRRRRVLPRARLRGAPDRRLDDLRLERLARLPRQRARQGALTDVAARSYTRRMASQYGCSAAPRWLAVALAACSHPAAPRAFDRDLDADERGREPSGDAAPAHDLLAA